MSTQPTIEEFVVGQSFWIKGSFIDDDGNPDDPTTVTFKTKDSAGDLQTYVYGVDAEVEKTSAGEYRLLFVQALSGWHEAEVRGEGDVDDAARIKWKGLPALE